LTREPFFRLPERSQRIEVFLSLGVQEIGYAMPQNTILQEAQKLHDVSERLDSLADEHPIVSEALITISGNVRQTATLLEVLVVTKMGPPSEPGPANA
jgi:hypothetical protein